MTRPHDNAYVMFLDWLVKATTVDPFDYADWLRANFADIAIDMEVGLTQEDVAVFLLERFVSEKRLNEYPKAECRYGC